MLLMILWGIAAVCIIAAIVCFLKHLIAIAIGLIILAVILFFVGVALPQSEEDKQKNEEYRKQKAERKAEKKAAEEEQQRAWLEQLTMEEAVEPITKYFSPNEVSLPHMNSIKIIEDSGNICSITIKPDIYFSRYDLILFHIDRLERMSNIPAKIKMGLIETKLNVTRYKDNLDSKFIKRFWDATLKQSFELKTEKARNNRYNKFYNTMQLYDNKLSESNIALYKSLCEPFCENIFEQS